MVTFRTIQSVELVRFRWSSSVARRAWSSERVGASSTWSATMARWSSRV